MMVHIPSGNGTPIFRDDFIISNSYASSSDESWTPSIPRLEPMDDYL
jgi:hypothetical protein